MSLIKTFALCPFDLSEIKFENNKHFHLDEKIYLEDVTIFIPVKIDSQHRLRNLKKSIENLNYFFKNTVYVLESSKSSQIDFDGNYQKIFTAVNDDVFYRNKITNSFIKTLKTEFILCLESDVLVDPKAILQCYDKLKSGEFKFTMPFNGVDAFLSEEISNTIDPKIKVPYLWKHYYEIDKTLIQKDYTMHMDYKHVGFCYFFNTLEFAKCGLENENFNTWGYDDIERFHRIRTLGNEIFYSDYFCYHLWHPRNSNQQYYDSGDKGRTELSKYVNLSKSEYLEMLNSINKNAE
jgi:hypothetical protein